MPWRLGLSLSESLAEVLLGGLCTAIVSPQGEVLAGPLGEGEDMAIAEIDLSAIRLQKVLLDTVGHYSRPDILRLSLDSTPRQVMEPIPPLVDDRPAQECSRENPTGENRPAPTPKQSR
jgi:hypothetical protein